MLIKAIKVIFTIVAAVFFVYEIRDFRKNAEPEKEPHKVMGTHFALGSVIEFFDTIGIGSFPVLTAIYRMFRLVPDELIPATLSVGTVIPCVYQSVGYLTAVDVDSTTLFLMMIVAACGGFVGTSVAKRIQLRSLRLIMGILLVIAAGMMLISQLGLYPVGGTATGLSGGKLAFGLACMFIFAFGTSFGGTMYGPMMCIVYLLGMDPLCAFPIMMCSATMSCTMNAVRYLKFGRFHRRAALGVELGAFVGCTIAIFLITSIPLNILRWVVLIIVTYNAVSLLHEGLRGKRNAARETKNTERATTVSITGEE